MEVNSEREVAQLCATLRDPMDCSLPGSSAHGILQARTLEWVAIAFSELTLYCFLTKYNLKRKINSRKSPLKPLVLQISKNVNRGRTKVFIL